MAKDRTFKEGLQLNLWGISVELRMKERRIEEGILIKQLAIRYLSDQGHLVVVAHCLVFVY